ncbi:unnamed protein product [Hymenolepis diminuta]|uniref:Uncharacterized protein n=1 Tax=Hymenolepis diminuta TaxID=6216 RepID=A0A564YK96_HYMDI|nr:unnamed protein product [Hymenolepis diminuta]
MNTNVQQVGFSLGSSTSTNYQELLFMVPVLNTVEGIANVNINPPNDCSDEDRVVSNYLQCIMSNSWSSVPHFVPIAMARIHQLPQQNQERETMRPPISNEPVSNVSGSIVKYPEIDNTGAPAHPLPVS